MQHLKCLWQNHNTLHLQYMIAHFIFLGRIRYSKVRPSEILIAILAVEFLSFVLSSSHFTLFCMLMRDICHVFKQCRLAMETAKMLSRQCLCKRDENDVLFQPQISTV